MYAKGPKNTSQYHWTNHAKFKMQFYGLSAQKVLGVISRPKRKEIGIVENTVAVMKPVSPKMVNGKEVWRSEVWAMYVAKLKSQNSNVKIETKKSKLNISAGSKQIKIISAWRYPGVSPKRNPIPESVLEEVKNIV